MKRENSTILVNQKAQKIDLLASLLITAFFLIFCLVALHRFWQYEAWYYDFGIFDTAIYKVSQFKTPTIDHFVVGGKHIFADHFHPIIFLLSPLYWFTDRPEIILIAQTLVVSLSGFVIYQLANFKLKNKKIALAFLLIYLSFVGLHNALITEFHEITLLPLPLSLFFLALEKRQVKLFCLATFFVLITKESTFIIPLLICTYQFFREKSTLCASLEAYKATNYKTAISKSNKWQKIFALTAIVCLVYGLVVIKIVIPHFNTSGAYQYLPSRFNIETITTLFETRKIKTIVETLASFAFLPLFAPHTLLPVMVNWFTRFIAGGRSDLGLHYNAELAPTLIYGTMLGFIKLQQLLAKSTHKLKLQIQHISKKFSKKITLLNNLDKHSIWQLTAYLLAVWAVVFSIYYFKSPALLAFNPAFYAHSKNFAFLNNLVEKVPTNNGVIMAQHNLATRFTHYQTYILRENYQDFEPQYIVVDQRAGQNPNNFLGIQEPEKLFEQLANDSRYSLFYDGGEQKIYQKN